MSSEETHILTPDDELRLYRGDDFIINKDLVIHQPTIDEICTMGESTYFGLVYLLTAVGADLKVRLDDVGIDYTKIKDFELFCSLAVPSLTMKETKILFGDCDFSNFVAEIDEDTQTLILRNKKNNVTIDEYTYMLITEVLRTIHGLKRNGQVPANEHTKRILIEDEREEMYFNSKKPKNSMMRNMISYIINNKSSSYLDNDIWSAKIMRVLDSVKRIDKVETAELLLQSAYSGFGVNIKDIDTKILDKKGTLE